jgi:hypothetical protein
MVDVLLIAGFVLLILYIVWSFAAIELTSRHRKVLIDRSYGQPYNTPDYDSREVLRKEYDTVSFDTHVRHLLFFRNPINLYPEYKKKHGSFK